jgi:hypothetical protein
MGSHAAGEQPCSPPRVPASPPQDPAIDLSSSEWRTQVSGHEVVFCSIRCGSFDLPFNPVLYDQNPLVEVLLEA